MGLSDEERYSVIANTITELQDHTLKDNFTYSKPFRDRYTYLTKLIEQLWPAFLGNTPNSLHWITGGDFSNDRLNSGLLFSAFEGQIPNDDNNQEIDRESFYSHLNIVNGMIVPENIMNDGTKGMVIKCYAACESISYGLHRYNDEFSVNLSGLNDVLRKMQGEIFSIFRRDEDFFRAYLLFHIIEACFLLKEDDLVSQWIVNDAIHHSLKLDRHENTSKKSLFETWKSLQFRRDITTQERLLVLLKIANKRFHHAHSHKKLLKMIQDHNNWNANDKVDIDSINKQLAENSKDYNNQNTVPLSDVCSITGNYRRE